ncbi:sigma-70 family RNA polymerase sigma factor [Candidatus Protofrankia californiensis]|uniref:sigma-70 family RNA polymerase sigma factor n=1 Tax=Candidatus Protofrankia californiensis TaxID=1839754 RepID=UPI001041633F|nr:sigma-70 family RNA polymerase sigma factor [Candidatus Protofrankia californiensis]
MTRPAVLAAAPDPDDSDNLPVFLDAGGPAETVTAPADTTDEVLAVWSAAGDAAAFAELYRRYTRMIASHLYRRRVDPGDVDDLIQEVFTTALELLHGGSFPDGSFRYWLLGYVVVRVLNGYFGKRWRHEETVGKATLAASMPRPDSTPPPGLSATFVAALATLTPQCRQVIKLRYLEGQSVAATALVVGIEERRVADVTRIAVRDLHRALTGTDRPRRPKAAPLAELLPIALEVATETLAAGDRWGLRTLKAGFQARKIPLSTTRAQELTHAVRAVMPETGTGRPTGLVRRKAKGGAR